MKVILEKTIEEWWGVDVLIASMEGCPKEEIERAIIDMLLEDPSALIDGLTWTFAEEEKKNA